MNRRHNGVPSSVAALAATPQHVPPVVKSLENPAGPVSCADGYSTPWTLKTTLQIAQESRKTGI